jgi:hypothetical protein
MQMDEWTDESTGETDTKKIAVTFHNFVNTSKNTMNLDHKTQIVSWKLLHKHLMHLKSPKVNKICPPCPPFVGLLKSWCMLRYRHAMDSDCGLVGYDMHLSRSATIFLWYLLSTFSASGPKQWKHIPQQ